MALLVIDAGAGDFSYEDELLARFRSRAIPVIVVANKIDLPRDKENAWFKDKPCVRVSALSGQGMETLRLRILEMAPSQWEPPFLRDLIRPGDIVVLVAPIDLGAPAGRLIMPQVKALRDVLDGDGVAMMCKERELPAALRALAKKPALVITDSQVFPRWPPMCPKMSR